MEDHLHHALGYLPLLPDGAAACLDLGSGGGVPGLVIATEAVHLDVTLLDAHERRTSFLREAVERLGLSDRVVVVIGRAEEAARRPELRSRFDVVVARSFGPPAILAECGAPFLCRNGVLIASEPPGGDMGRWPPSGLLRLGLAVDQVVDGPPALVRLRRVAPLGDAWPRRTGMPRKRPLW